MARYKPYDYGQQKLIAVDFESQILPGTFEYTLAYLVDHKLDLSGFEARYQNDETGAPAYAPAILLKVVLYSYARGITSSRAIARACVENVMFMALSADSQPHFTTIAGFISTMGEEATQVFRDVLVVCDEEGLLGREMFAVDGVKLPSNASKEWSGTRASFEAKVEKMESALKTLVSKHRRADKASEKRAEAGGNGPDDGHRQREEKTRARLEHKLEKLRGWLDTSEDRQGYQGRAVQSNLTDPDSAKMASSHGVIQGYVGVSVVDAQHQVIVNGEAFGQGSELSTLQPVLEGTRGHLKGSKRGRDILSEVAVTADSGFHNAANVQWLYESGIDGYLADKQMRKRDSRYAGAERYYTGRALWGNDRSRMRSNRFGPKDFDYDAKTKRCRCPTGQKMYIGFQGEQDGRQAIRFKGTKGACGSCAQRDQCLRHPQHTAVRQVTFFGAPVARAPADFVEQMKAKIDSEMGRAKYAMRLAVAEPPFANIRSTLGLDRFRLRGKAKVDAQWKLYCTVHNLGKLHRYAYEDAF